MSRDESRKWFTWMDRDDSGFVDLLDWNELIADNRKFSKLFNVIDPVVSNSKVFFMRTSQISFQLSYYCSHKIQFLFKYSFEIIEIAMK